jgi:signal transduction histidine kinase
VSPSRWGLPAGRDPRDSRSGDRGGDPGLVRAFALLRVLVSVTICVSALFIPVRTQDTTLWLIIIAAGYLPLSVAILVAARRPRSRLVVVVGPIADLVMLTTAQALLHQGIGLTACYPIIAAFAAYTWSGLPIWALAGFTLGLSLSVQSQLPPSQRFTAERFALFAALVIGVLLIVDRATIRSRGAEERFARAKTRADAILAAVGSAVVVTDSTSRVLTANPAAGSALSSEEPLEGQLCSSALGLHLGERRLDCSTGCQLLKLSREQLATEAAADGEPARGASDLPGHSADPGLRDFEAWRPTKEGGRQPLLVSVNVLPAAEGPEFDVVHSIRDISRLKQADEAKTLFLATTSHELKTPLTVINGFAKTLTTRTLTPDKQREALAAIRRRGEELARVVDRLLLSSRIEAGRAEVSHAVVDLIPLVYERAAGLASATDRQIDVDLPDDLPSVIGDPSAIVTVIDHLLDNAVKYSPDGQPISVRAEVSTSGMGLASGRDEPATVLVEVTDSGVGMDPETVEHCFDKFWQADASGTRRFGGTGIGLYIVRSLVDAMGGSISVHSESTGGSTFSVRLQVAEMAPAISLPTTPRRLPRVPRVTRPVEAESAPISQD